MSITVELPPEKAVKYGLNKPEELMKGPTISIPLVGNKEKDIEK